MKNLKSKRLALGLTQKELCDILGLPLRSYQNWEQGRYKPPSYVYDMIVTRFVVIEKNILSEKK